MSRHISIVTDSTADLPSNLVVQHGIHVVPNILVIEGKSYEDGNDISREEFYELLPKMKAPPTTATASVGAYQTLYEKLLKMGAEAILSLHASSLLSGIYNTAVTAAQAFAGRVRVIDSEQVSMGLGFQVLAAAESLAKGSSLQEILQRIKEVQEKIRVVAMLDTLEYVRRSGRVSWARAHLGNLLSIKPFIELRRGKVLSLGEVRTRQKGIERVRKMLAEIGAIEHLAVLHTNAEQEARMLLEEVKNKIKNDPFIVHVTTVIGTHVGPRGLGFAAVTA